MSPYEALRETEQVYRPDNIPNPKYQADGKFLVQEFKDLEDDMRFNLSHLWSKSDSSFLHKVAIQVQYIQSTKRGLERVLGTVTDAPDKR